MHRTLSKAEQSVRSISHTIELLPGPPIRANLEQDPRASAAGPITVTNGGEDRGRVLLSSVAVQLRDEHGNAVALDGVAVRWVLGWPGEEDAVEGQGCAGEPGPAPASALAAGAELPALQVRRGPKNPLAVVTRTSTCHPFRRSPSGDRLRVLENLRCARTLGGDSAQDLS
jgi:hypothetical protein